MLFAGIVPFRYVFSNLRSVDDLHREQPGTSSTGSEQALSISKLFDIERETIDRFWHCIVAKNFVHEAMAICMEMKISNEAFSSSASDTAATRMWTLTQELIHHPEFSRATEHEVASVPESGQSLEQLEDLLDHFEANENHDEI